MSRRIPLLIVVWSVASLFFVGDLGKYADDYFLARHDPVSLAPTPLPPLGALSFARPLNWLLVNWVAQKLWLHDQAQHVVNAVAHGAVAALVATLLFELGASAAATAAATTLFLVYPAPFEVVLWPAALPVAVGCGLLLVVCLATVRLARRDAAGLRSPGTLSAVALLSFAVACLYEQCAAALLGLPLLYRAAEPTAAGRSRRSLRVGAVAWVSVAAYVVLYWVTAPAQARGMPSALPSLEVLGSDVVRVAYDVGRRLTMVEFANGAFRLGTTTLADHPVAAAALVMVTIPCAWLAMRPARLGDRAGRALCVLVAPFGLVVFASSWLPVLAATGTPVSSRLTYTPALGLAIVVAVALDRVARARLTSTSTRWLRHVTTVAVAITALSGCIAMVGVQAAYRARTHGDTALGEALTRTVPRPASQTVFLVLSDARRPVATGAAAFDGEFVSPIALPQAATPWVSWAYRRRDLVAAQPVAWGVRIADASETGVRLVGLETAFEMEHPAHPDGGIVVPWSHLLPLRVEHDGAIRVESPAAVRPQR